MAHLTYPIRSNKLSVNIEIKAHLLHKQTEFQTIDIYDTDAFGKVMYLDNHIQLAELDEHAYHEALVHIPLLSTPGATRALVVGGGDGAVLRELVKHQSLKTIDMVEIDAQVIEASKQVMPALSDGAFEDPRVNLHIQDAFPFLKDVREPYDLIIMDITDLYEDEEGGLSQRLFTEEFHRDCAQALSERGLLVSQADNHVFCPYSLEDVMKTFGAIFPVTGWYQALVPSFMGFSAYGWASKSGGVRKEWPGAPFPMRYLNEATWVLAQSDFKM